MSASETQSFFTTCMPGASSMPAGVKFWFQNVSKVDQPGSLSTGVLRPKLPAHVVSSPWVGGVPKSFSAMMLMMMSPRSEYWSYRASRPEASSWQAPHQKAPATKYTALWQKSYRRTWSPNWS
jgi:hypothetical protein